MMENQNNGGINEVQKSKEKAGVKFGGGGIGWCEMVLRVLALLLTLVAAVLLGVDKQTKTVSFSISTDLPPFNVPVTAKSKYLSAFVYFVVVNSTASAYAAITLALISASKSGGRGGVTLRTIVLMDLMMLALLFSSIGAAAAVGVLGFKGNSHVRWNKVCNVYGKFCHQVMASIFLSLVGGIVYFILAFLSASKFQRRS